MKFNFPYKLYSIGLILMLLTFVYSLFVLFKISQEGLVMWPFVVIVSILCYYLVRFYLRKIRFYKDIHLIVDNKHIHFHQHQKDIYIDLEELDVIFYARHQQNLKIHHVIHVFKNDGTYFYVTNEIIHFNKLKELLSKTYPKHYYETSQLIKGFQRITKGFLFTFR